MGFDPVISEWGNPPEALSLFAPRSTMGLTRYLETESIGHKKQTRGTETSQYPEERTSIETPLVVASERGPAEPGE